MSWTTQNTLNQISLDHFVEMKMRKVRNLVKTLPPEFTFRELLKAANYDDVEQLNRPMRARITRAINSSYRTDKKRDGLRLYFKQRPNDLEGYSFMINDVVDWVEELKMFGWIEGPGFSY